MAPQPRLLPRKLTTLLLLVGAVGLLCWLLVIVLTPIQDVWIYVNGAPGPELQVFVDGQPTPLDPKLRNHFRCCSGTREIIIKQGDAVVFHETKTLLPSKDGKFRKYLVSPTTPGLYYTFELEYVDLKQVFTKLRQQLLPLDDATQFVPTDEIFPEQKQAKINTLYQRQLEVFRKVRFQAAEGKWLDVADCHCVLQYPPSSARLKPPKTTITLRTIVAALSQEHFERMKRSRNLPAPTLDDLRFLDDLLALIENSGGSTAPYTE